MPLFSRPWCWTHTPTATPSPWAPCVRRGRPVLTHCGRRWAQQDGNTRQGLGLRHECAATVKEGRMLTRCIHRTERQLEGMLRKQPQRHGRGHEEARSEPDTTPGVPSEHTPVQPLRGWGGRGSAAHGTPAHTRCARCAGPLPPATSPSDPRPSASQGPCVARKEANSQEGGTLPCSGHRAGSPSPRGSDLMHTE